MSYLSSDADLLKIRSLEHRMRNPSLKVNLEMNKLNMLGPLIYKPRSSSSSPESKENENPDPENLGENARSLKRKAEIEFDMPLSKLKKRSFIEEMGSENSNDLKNNRKITEFFKKHKEKSFKFTNDTSSFEKKIKLEKKIVKNVNNVVSNYVVNSNITEENFKLKEEIRKLNRKLVDKDNLLKNEEAKLKGLIEKNKTLLKTLQDYDNQTVKNKQDHQLICKLLLDCEKLKKQEIKNQLNTQKQRLGEYVSQRQGHKFVDVWADGYEFRNLKEKLENIKTEKENLEKTKKNLKIKKNGTLNPYCQSYSFKCEGKESKLLDSDINQDSNSTSEPNIFDMKNRISFQMNILQKEEISLIEELKKLEQEKTLFIYQSKRQFEEDHSRFAKRDNENNFSPWPLLNNRYQLVSLLGKGGFSEVYKAFDFQNFLEVACKMHQLHQSWNENAKNQYIKHALRENTIHQTLVHPNIVKSYDIIEIDPNTICIVLEYCEGPDLSQYLKQHKQLSEKDCKCILRQILSGLRYLHEHRKKIIHYDLKPQNILFHKGEIKISDFGLCKIIEDNATRLELTSQGVGTYWYLPPECFEVGDNPPIISTKVDIWSVGVIVYEMLYGEKPYGNGMSQEKILKENVILNAEGVRFPLKPVISGEAKEFIYGCLMRDPEKRWDVATAISSNFLNKK